MTHADADQAAVDQVELPQPFLFLLRVLPEPGSVLVHRHHPLSRVSRSVHPGKVFDLTLPLEDAAEGYRAMDERRAIKTLLRP
jgi:hypothetical protein